MLKEWLQLPKSGIHFGTTGQNKSSLWEATLTYRMLDTFTKSRFSQVFPPKSDGDALEVESASRLLAQPLGLSRLLDRRYSWPAGLHQQKGRAGSEKLLPRIQQMLDGWRKEDPPGTDTNVLEFLVNKGNDRGVTELNQCYSYLICVGKYAVKGA
jgi:hypothetical protein